MWWASAAVAAAGLVAGSMAPAAATVARHGTAAARRPHASPGSAVHGVYPVRFHFHKPPNQADHRYVPGTVHWPAAGTARLALRAPAAGAAQGTQARAAGTPVWAQAVARRGAAPRTLGVRVLSQVQARAVGLNGVLFAVRPTAVAMARSGSAWTTGPSPRPTAATTDPGWSCPSCRPAR
jgi:hypothetical protein